MLTDDAALDAVDQRRLRDYLGQVVAMGDSFTVAVLSGGRSNLTYLVDSGDHAYVVRRRPLGAVASGAHDMGREYRVQSALQHSGIPVPVVYSYCDDPTIVGAPFYVMSRVAGRVFHARPDVADLTAQQASSVSEATVSVLDQIHRVDVEAVGLADLGRPGGFVARRIDRWLEQWRAGGHRDHPLVESLGEALARQVPADTDSTLIHGDYRLGNMVVDTGSPSPIASVLDWEMSTLGDPLTDLAHLMVYWDPTRERVTHDSQTIADHPGFWRSGDLARYYAEMSGRDISGLDFYLAFEHWRAAIIKEGIYARTRHSADSLAEALGSTVALHLQEARDILAGA